MASQETPKQSPHYYGLSLWIYDWIVLGFNLRYGWKCPLSVQLQFFRTYFTRNHLDVGVATGYFPATALKFGGGGGGAAPDAAAASQEEDKCRLTLVDIEKTTLDASRDRILRQAPITQIQCVQADATAPLPEVLRGQRFDSVAMFNLLHCIPGKEKVRAFGVYKDAVAAGGVLYGCTLLGEQYARGWFSRWYAGKYEKKGIFNCRDDTKEMFDDALEEAFEEVETWIVGQMLLFKATKPRH
ncbi:methyltransferase domain-containing protein [Xylariaceae sp. FL0016]|nr:methyltransferase domain-containing protein [Xylariaceae sp. FL0016]